MSLKKKLLEQYRIVKHNILMRQPYKISFCTVCMNRLHHIKQTLPANLRDNATYSNAEFVLLDYNSSDGLEQWVKSDLKEFIDSGRLVYYRTTEPQYFHRSHSRNMAYKLASGHIICNVDADNYTGKNFAHYINKQFIANNNIFIVPDIKMIHYFIRDVFGRICCWKKDFDAIGGFDEQLEGYGHEDVDFAQRLEKLNREEVIIFNFSYLKAIAHTDLERVQHEFMLTNLKGLYISHITPHSSCVIFLFLDGTFCTGTLVDIISENSLTIPSINHHEPTSQSLNGRYVLAESAWSTGVWQENEQSNLRLLADDNTEEFYIYGDQLLTLVNAKTHQSFSRITDQRIIIRAINYYSLIKNSSRVKENKTRNLQSTNELAVGKGAVIKNFVEEVTLTV